MTEHAISAAANSQSAKVRLPAGISSATGGEARMLRTA
jgi:hypothetical protein